MRAEVSILPLKLKCLGYSIDQTDLLSDISLTILPGRTMIIVGPNGAGKSLFLRLCHGLIKPTSGQVSWNIVHGPGKKHAMVFQHPILLRRSARANIAHALSLTGISRKAANARLVTAIEKFGLQDLESRPARQLSGGEQQRLAIARAWALKPELLFLDEPTAHLDPGATRIIESALNDFRAEGITIVMTTHDIAQVRRLADDVTLLHRGRLIETGPADEFLSNPKTGIARAYLAGELIW